MSDAAQTDPTPSTALTEAKPVKPPAPLEVHDGAILPIMPRNIDEAMRYANGLIAAGVVPASFKDGGVPNASKVLMGVMKAMELGVAPQTGLAGLYLINDRFSVYGDLAIALVERTGQIQTQQVAELGKAFDPNAPIGEWPDEYGYRVMYWRKGQSDPYVGTFTVRDAKRAGLWGNARRQPWLLYPKRMLFNRARAFALRDGFADGLAGLTIAEEVLDALPPPVEERGQSTRLAALTEESDGEPHDR